MKLTGVIGLFALTAGLWLAPPAATPTLPYMDGGTAVSAQPRTYPAGLNKLPDVKGNVTLSSHVQDIGTRHVSSTVDLLNGRSTRLTLGTTAQGRRLEMVQVSNMDVRLDGRYVIGDCLRVQGHVQNIGWQGAGTTAGTTGRSLRLEAVRISSRCSGIDVQYRAHVQNVGWQSWVGSGKTAGTTGRNLHIEALQVTVTFPDLSGIKDDYQGADRRMCKAFGTC